MIGETIGNFRVLQPLGRGGMGEVFLAEQTAVQTRVAIKILHRDISSDREHVQRFFNEARVVGRIKHAAIVKIFDVGFHREHAYLVMELLEGESLASRIARAGRLAAPQIANIGRQIASALASTHAAGVIHRDLKPDNIFVVADEDLGHRERIKILDFGIAKLSGTLSAASPRTAGTMGTPGYMAPEQWGDSGSVDWRADAYSLGCVVFEMACGRPPFEVRTIAEACAAHLSKPPPELRSLAPDAPPELEALVARLLAKSPEARGTSMVELARAFEALGGGRATLELAEPAVSGSMPAGAVARPSGFATTLGASSGVIEAPRRPRRRLAIAGLATIVAAVGIAVIATRTDGASGSDRDLEAPPAAPAAGAQPPALAAPAPSPPAAPPPTAAAGSAPTVNAMPDPLPAPTPTAAPPRPTPAPKPSRTVIKPAAGSAAPSPGSAATVPAKRDPLDGRL